MSELYRAYSLKTSGIYPQNYLENVRGESLFYVRAWSIYLQNTSLVNPLPALWNSRGNYHWCLHSSQTHQTPGTALTSLPPGHEVTLVLPHLGHFSGVFKGEVASRTNLRSELSLTIIRLFHPQLCILGDLTYSLLRRIVLLSFYVKNACLF
jgi:hypothetical protein